MRAARLPGDALSATVARARRCASPFALRRIALVAPCVGILLAGSAVTGCERDQSAGALQRRECEELTLRVDRLKNAELGAASDVDRDRRVDRCMKRGTRPWAECVKFAQTASAVTDCERL
ncbi:MAG TPA: hypothetical protein PKA88_05000 [Polyangiaceae bacterium]|nr:hypothetical protein [Polyangiaceae bacterium]